MYLLVEIHSGMDLGWSYDRLLPEVWGAGVHKHATHHRDGDGGSEPLFMWWMRVL